MSLMLLHNFILKVIFLFYSFLDITVYNAYLTILTLNFLTSFFLIIWSMISLNLSSSSTLQSRTLSRIKSMLPSPSKNTTYICISIIYNSSSTSPPRTDEFAPKFFLTPPNFVFSCIKIKFKLITTYLNKLFLGLPSPPQILYISSQIPECLSQ